jgi:integrase
MTRRFGQIEQLPSGKYRARYHGPNGKRYTLPKLYMDDRRALHDLDVQKRRIDRGTWEPPIGKDPGVLTLGGYARSVIATRTNRHGEPLAKTTQYNYERLLSGPLASLASKRLESIGPAQVREWHAAQLAKGTHTLTARAYALLRLVFGQAVRDGRLDSNPANARGAANRKTGRKVEPPTRAQLDKLVEAVPDEWRALVILAAWGGLRWGELSELRRSDLKITKTTLSVTVARAVVNVPGAGFVVKPPKSDMGARTNPLPAFTRAALTHHLNTHTGPEADALLFHTKTGGHVGESWFYRRVWKTAREGVGRPDLGLHALRHFGATRFAGAGATVAQLQRWLGDSTPAAALGYLHADDDNMSELVEAMGR